VCGLDVYNIILLLDLEEGNLCGRHTYFLPIYGGESLCRTETNIQIHRISIIIESVGRAETNSMYWYPDILLPDICRIVNYSKYCYYQMISHFY